MFGLTPLRTIFQLNQGLRFNVRENVEQMKIVCQSGETLEQENQATQSGR